MAQLTKSRWSALYRKELAQAIDLGIPPEEVASLFGMAYHRKEEPLTRETLPKIRKPEDSREALGGFVDELPPMTPPQSTQGLEFWGVDSIQRFDFEQPTLWLIDAQRQGVKRDRLSQIHKTLESHPVRVLYDSELIDTNKAPEELNDLSLICIIIDYEAFFERDLEKQNFL